jgi:hypothetical protein
MKELMKNDCAILEDCAEPYWDNKMFCVTDCEGNQYFYSSLTWAKKRFDKITYLMMKGDK